MLDKVAQTSGFNNQEVGLVKSPPLAENLLLVGYELASATL